jgi:acetyl/propionyl-CoA carboxylase alpha subunit
MSVILVHGDREFVVDVLSDGRVQVGDEIYEVARERQAIVRIGGRTAWVISDGASRWVFFDGCAYRFSERRAAGRRSGARREASLVAPMPATVGRILVSAGDRVAPGDTLMILEAMKMELPVRTTTAGVVRALLCRVGDLVQPGVTLIDIDEA